jgi:hypothetical protein
MITADDWHDVPPSPGLYLRRRPPGEGPQELVGFTPRTVPQQPDGSRYLGPIPTDPALNRVAKGQ